MLDVGNLYKALLDKSVVLLGLFALAGLAQPADAAITNYVAGMTASGSAPFDANDNAGNDSGLSNSIIRTNDFATYRVGYAITPSDTSGRIVLAVGATTLPGSYVGPANPQIAYFSVADLPTGANGCQNISATAVADPPAAGVSGVTANGQKIYCAQPSPSSGNNLDFRMRIAGTAPNGATVAAPTVTYSSTSNAANSTPTVLNGTVGTESFFGMPTLTVSAAPRWNLRKSNDFRGALFVPGSGPAGEDGFVFSWNLGLFAKGSRKGLEAINGAYTISENFNDSDFPNAQFVNWNINSPGYMVFNFTASGINGCGDWRSQIPILGNSVDNVFYYPNDYGVTNNSTVVYQVARGGTCDLSVVDNALKTATLTLNNTDFSLNFYPTRRGTNSAAATLVNASNLDDANNEWWVASKSIAVWAPLTDVPTPPSPNTRFLTNTATLNATSVTGQINVEPITTDNAHTEGATRATAGSLSKTHTVMRLTNPFGLDYALCDPNVTGDCHVNQVAPNQVFSTYLKMNNGGTSVYPAGQFCDRIDNTRLTFFDATSASYAATGGAVKDAPTGIATVFLSGPQFPLTFELGVGGTGISGGTWSTMNTVTSEYSSPATTGAAQSDTACGDADATWYPSVAALLAAEGPTGLQKVTRVRAKYTSFPAASYILVYIPQQVNPTYTYSGTDNAPGAAFSAGTSTIGAMTVNQLLWETNVPGVLSATGAGKASDAVKIFQNEYVRISKTSTSNPIANSLVPVGSVVTYNLTVNLTTSGSAHTTDVTVWDVLPQYMSYVPLSSTLGGAALPDPVCATSGLPAALFPTQPLTGGVTACRWTLTAQTAAKVAEGSAAGNLPVLAFRAVVDVLAPNTAQLLNSSFADSLNNSKPDAVYQGAGSGFACAAGQNCSFSNWNLTVSSTPGILLSKQVSKTLVPLNTGFSYTLNYAAVGNALDGVRLLDVLPYTSDGRVPASNYVGTLKLTAPIAAPVAAAGPPVVVADPNAIVLYTSNAYGNIIRDPYDAGHNLTGGGTNSATTTNWCTTAQFGAANCPANIGAVTGFLVQPRVGASPVSNQLQPGNSYALLVPVIAASNAVGNIYSNDFVGDSTSLSARRPGSNIVTTTVVAPDLIITKTAAPTTVIAGQTTTFTLTAKNNTGANVGPIENVPGTVIRVTDPMPSGLTALLPLSGTNWDCSASTASNVDCTYTGSLPIGVGATIGGPITVTAQTAASVANNTAINNTATVTMTGQAEQPTTNNTSTASITVLRNPDATIVKTVSPGTVQNGGTVIYTLRASLVATEGDLAGGPVIISDTMPADLTIAGAGAAIGTNWDCSASAAPSTVSCTYTGTFALSAGSQIGGNITVTATAGTVAGSVVRNNSATVTAPGDSNPSNNTSTVPVTIQGTTTLAGRVYSETGGNTTDNGNATDPGLASNITLACTGPGTTPAFNAGPVATAADGSYSFSGVPIGATCTVTQTQPAGYVDAYTTAGATASGTPSTTGTTISGIVVPATGSPGNNFAELRTADTTSSMACVPNPANPTQSVTCTLTCTNNGPGAAVGASCQFTGTLPAGVTANSCSTPVTSASLAVNGTLSCALTFPAPLNGSVTVTGGSSASNDTNGGNVATAGNNPSSATVGVNGVTVSGRVYREASAPANTADNGNTTDPGLVTAVSISCTTPAFSAGPLNTAADGTYTFANVPAGASCTITETQPAGYTNAYNTPGTGGTGNTGGTAGSSGNSTITLTVPATGSTGNNFAEQSADMVSRVSCTPSGGEAGTQITCTATCTNNGPGAAVNGFCAITNASSLPGSPTPTCSPSANVAIGSTLTCTVSFVLTGNPTVFYVNAGTGADNDINGGATASAGNNPSSSMVVPNIPVPAWGGASLLATVFLVLVTGLRNRRRVGR